MRIAGHHTSALTENVKHQQAAIELSEVAKVFGSTAVLRRVSLALAPGSIAVLLGENGAGKSTLLRLVAGLASVSRGSVRIFGEDPRDNHVDTVRQRIAYVSHASMLYDELSAPENLRYFYSLHQAAPTSCACSASPEMALRAVGLDPALTRPVGQFSQGMRQRTGLACALQSDPDVLLLDEPLSNLDTKGVQQMLELLRDFRTWPSRREPGMHRTVLLTTHQAALALPIADVVLTLKGGFIESESAESYKRRAGPA